MNVKKFITLIIITLSINTAMAQTSVDSVLTEVQKDYAEANRYQIYQYHAVLVHLDTYTGRLKYVDYKDSPWKVKYVIINDNDLSNNGRGNFVLYKVWPYFVLLDKTNGNSWQVELSHRAKDIVFRKLEDSQPK